MGQLVGQRPRGRAGWQARHGPLRTIVRGFAPALCSGRVVVLGLRRSAGPTRCASLWRSGAERADCPAVLGLAPASRNSLRALRALRSDRRDENDDERASRWAQALRSSAPQRRAARGPRGPSQPGLWLALRQAGARSLGLRRNEHHGLSIVAGSPGATNTAGSATWQGSPGATNTTGPTWWRVALAHRTP